MYNIYIKNGCYLRYDDKFNLVLSYNEKLKVVEADDIASIISLLNSYLKTNKDVTLYDNDTITISSKIKSYTLSKQELYKLLEQNDSRLYNDIVNWFE